MTHGLGERQQSAICGRHHCRYLAREIEEGLEGWRRPLLGGVQVVVSVEESHGDEALVEIGEQADSRVVLHGFLDGACCLEDFDIVVRVVEGDCVLDVD